MDRYFYSVEIDENGKKIIHLSGNVYGDSEEETGKNYRCAEWTFFYIPINMLKELVEEDSFYEYVNDRIDYLGDLTKEEAVETCEQYFNGKPGTHLRIAEVDEETPCGDYWFDTEVES